MSTPPHLVSSSDIASFIEPEWLESLLAPWVPDPEDRRYVVRCIVDLGPAHHRGANYVLLRLLGLAVERRGRKEPPAGPSVPLPIRLPPHLRTQQAEHHYPLPLPTGLLARLVPAGSKAHAAMVDCLTDGPPQHALANAAMLCLLTELLAPGEE